MAHVAVRSITCPPVPWAHVPAAPERDLPSRPSTPPVALRVDRGSSNHEAPADTPMMKPLSTLALALSLTAASCRESLAPSERLLVMDVASQTVPCAGSFPQQCLVVRQRPDTAWTYFYDPIEDFTFVSGFEYTLRVAMRQIRNPPADGSSVAFRLVEVLRKSAAM